MSRGLTNRRIRLLLLVFGVVFVGALVRTAWLQAYRAPSLSRLAEGQHRASVTLPAGRGAILDRTGLRLAIRERATTVYAHPRQVRDPARVARIAGRELGVAPQELYASLVDRSQSFVFLSRRADPARALALARRRLPGLGFYPEERRLYPQGEVGAQVLGYAGVDNRGLAGLEQELDSSLTGRPGRQTYVRDPRGRAIDVISTTESREGSDVRLTLDHTLQAQAEDVLRETRRRWRAKAATAIVLSPRTGEVLAMASAPGFDANRYSQVAPELTRNRAVADTYEPGSTFKAITVAAALSERVVTPSTVFTLPYRILVADRWIGEHEPRATERMTVARILSQSSNVGAIKLAQRLGPDRLARWIERFGFGRATGIDLPGESTGIVPPVSSWSGSTIGNLPLGQGLAVTPVQMAAAYGAIANGGMWVEPHLVDRTRGGNRPPRRRRIVTGAIAKSLVRMLTDVVRKGTGGEAAIPGYSVAGKTGTAAKADAQGYSRSRYVASFVGFVPASAPRLVVLVTVDEPKGVIWGGVVAAPAFAEIANFGLQYLEVTPDAPASLAAAVPATD